MQKTIRYQDQSLAYESIGSGLPVMLVHGFTEDRHIWDNLTDWGKEKYQWLVPDLPGSGASSFNKNLVSITDFATALNAVREAENIPQMAIIGHSLGGYISLALAERYPETVGGLGLFHSTAYEDTPEKKETRKKSMQFIRNYGSAPYVEQSLPGLFSDSFKKDHPEVVREQIDRYANFNPDSLVQYLNAMMNRKDKTGILKAINAPVLFIMGEEDQAAPLKDVLKQCHLPQISYIHVLSDTAHMGMLENTILCNSFVDRFLKQIHV
jgi:pimeloyl-ACP methyl ester carboxylesterase